MMAQAFSRRTILGFSLSVLGVGASSHAAQGWDLAAADVWRANFLDQLRAVNDWVHLRVRYVADEHDDWQTPAQTLARQAGDCEDFAILKYALLRKSGYPRGALRLAYGYTTAFGPRIAHMVLLADIPGETSPRVLDNMGDVPLPLEQRTDYSVVFTFNEDGVWRKASNAHAANKTALSRWNAVVAAMRTDGLLPVPEI